MASSQAKLASVEAMRGIAALAVVVFHSNSAALFIGHEFLEPLAVGEHGVDFFFVLSGFIIFFVHGAEAGQPERARDYLVKRFIRLLPILWIVTGTCLLVKAAIGHPVSGSVAATSLLLYPSEDRPYPIVLWTLRHEILFYLAFLVLILHRTAGLVLFSVWTLACLIQLGLAIAGQPMQGLSAFLTSTYQLDFILGALLAVIHRRWSFNPSFLPLTVGCALVAIFAVLEQTLPFHREGVLDYVSLPATLGTLALGLAFTVLLHGLLCLEPIVRVPGFLLSLGAASYSVYLVHTPLNSLSQQVVVSWPSGLSHLFIVAVGVMGGLALHRWVERPLVRALRRKTLPSQLPERARDVETQPSLQP